MRGATFGELRAVCDADLRRQVRDMDARAWMVAHLMIATGNMRRGTRVDTLMRDLLGREPGVVPGEPEPERPTLSPEASVEYMAAMTRAMGGEDRRQ